MQIDRFVSIYLVVASKLSEKSKYFRDFFPVKNKKNTKNRQQFYEDQIKNHYFSEKRDLTFIFHEKHHRIPPWDEVKVTKHRLFSLLQNKMIPL